MSFPVHVPFIAGQDESWDKKLLPMGPVRAIKNMFFERNGRLVPRRACETESFENEIGHIATVGLADPNTTFAATSDSLAIGLAETGAKALYSWAPVPGGTGNHLLRRPGSATMWSKGKTIHPDRDRGAGQRSGHIALNSLGGIVRSYEVIGTQTFVLGGQVTGYPIISSVAVSQVAFEVCDENANVLFSLVTDDLLASPSSDTYISHKMIHSSVADVALLLIRTAGGSFFYFIETKAPYTINKIKNQGWSGSPASWDIYPVPGEFFFLMAADFVDPNDPSNRFPALVRVPFWRLPDLNKDVIIEGADISDQITCTGVVGDYYMIGRAPVAMGLAPLRILRRQGTAQVPLPLFGWDDIAPQFNGLFNIAARSWTTPGVAADKTPLGTALHLGITLENRETVFFGYLSGKLKPIEVNDLETQLSYEVVAAEQVTGHPLATGTQSVYPTIPWNQFETDSGREFELSGLLHLISPSGSHGGIPIPLGAQRRTALLPLPARRGGRVLWAYDYNDGFKGSGANRVAAFSVEEDTVHGVKTRDGEVFIPGIPLTVFDGHNVVAAGFDVGPIVVSDALTVNTPGGSTLTEGATYYYQFIAEWRDANGRIWRSAPTVPRKRLITAPDNRVFSVEVMLGFTVPQNGARILGYLSKPNGTVVRKVIEATLAAGTKAGYPGGFPIVANALFTFKSDPTDFDPLPYTSGNLLPNDPAPDCSMLVRTRSRLWVAGLPNRPSSVQASQTLVDTLGPAWSNADNFFINLPGEVTALAAMDDSVVAFTETGIFVIGGDGPNPQGIGGFAEPQSIPTNVGCVSQKSVIVYAGGIFFQSQKGIESIGRGAGSPEWIGQPVMGTIQQYPNCRGVMSSQDDNTIRWLFSNDHSSVVIVYDLRIGAWMVYQYAATADFISGGPEMRLSGALLTSVRRELNVGEDPENPGSLIATQSLRVGGLNGWAYGKRMNILGEYLGPCRVTLEFDFNDKPHLPLDTYTWTLDSTDYAPGDPVQLELDLPVYNYNSVNFRLYTFPPVQSQADPIMAAGTLRTFAANGITVYFDPAENGPRLASFQKG